MNMIKIKQRINIEKNIIEKDEVKINRKIEWSLYSKDNKFLSPIKWKGGDQLKCVNEILDEFNNKSTGNAGNAGNNEKQKILFLLSLCGSGKSTVLLNTIKEMGRGIIIVPSLHLQDQYFNDYSSENSMYILKDNKDINSKLKIGTMFGRNNFTCRYLKDAVEKGESVLDNGLIIFDKLKITCGMKGLPCNRTLKRNENRITAGSKCPYFILPPRNKEDIDKMKRLIDENNVELGTYLNKSKKLLKCNTIKYYNGVDGNEYGLFIRDENEDSHEVCGYYKQFYNYLADVCDVIVFNRWKWEIETKFGRKAVVDIETIDEADDFLNGLNQSVIINNNMITKMYKINKSESDMSLDELKINECKVLLHDKFIKIHKEISEHFLKGEYYGKSVLLAKTLVDEINNLIEYVNELKDNDNYDGSGIDDETNEIIYKLELINKYISKTAITLSENMGGLAVHYNIPYPDLILKDLLGYSSNKILCCSGTKHNVFTTEKLYGLHYDKIIYGRRDQPGNLIIMKPKKPMVEVTYRNWSDLDFQRNYNILLSYIVSKLNVKGETLVLTPAKKYVHGLVKYLRIKNVNCVVDFASYEDVENEKSGLITGDKVGNKVTVSYRMKRGIDLKDDKCRVVIWCKYPLVNINDGYIKALFVRFEKNTWTLLNDMANMETIQGVCRGLRSDEDWCVFATPDIKVYRIVEKWWNEMQNIKNDIR